MLSFFDSEVFPISVADLRLHLTSWAPGGVGVPPCYGSQCTVTFVKSYVDISENSFNFIFF